MAAVSDSSPLIRYARIGRLEILKMLFETVYIPEAVRSEILYDDARRPGAAAVVRMLWILTRPVRASETLVRLSDIVDLGEAEAIALSLELGPGFRCSWMIAKAVGLPISSEYPSSGVPACCSWRRDEGSSLWFVHFSANFSQPICISGHRSAKSFLIWPQNSTLPGVRHCRFRYLAHFSARDHGSPQQHSRTLGPARMFSPPSATPDQFSPPHYQIS